ncbi:methyl-accepting chemotaxis protein [Pseudovibrio flavus]|uniref:methyl-accepting chemotaxis protein n=1 Tax=Pseudovibrio flavus TaxID=2529854 RepID=UPI00211C549E|nr:methyl-accepting chemotaxis protein [Pseudovibrio flavus]
MGKFRSFIAKPKTLKRISFLPRLGNLSIRVRILSLSAMALLGIGSIAAIDSWGQMQSNAAFDEAQAYSELAAYTRDVAVKAGQLQSLQSAYQNGPTATLAQRFTEVSDEAVEALNYINTLETAGDYFLETLDAIDTIKGITATFSELHGLQEKIGLDADSGLQQTLNSSLLNASNLINQNTRRTKDPNALKLIASVAQVRQTEYAFTIKGTDVAEGDFEVAFSRFDRFLPRVELPENVRSEIAGDMEAYRAAFNEYVGFTKKRAKKADLLVDLFALLPPRLDALKNAAVEGAKLAEVHRAEIADQMKIITFSAIGIAAAIALLFGVWVTRSIMVPLNKLKTGMLRLAEGDVSVEIPENRGGKEVVEMARSVQVFRDSLIERRSMAEARDQETKERDARSQRVDDLIVNFEQKIGSALQSLNKAADGLGQASVSVEQAADNVSSEAVSAGSAVESATQNVANASSATEELAMSINEIAGQTEQSTRVAGEAASNSRTTVETMSQLNEAANRIGDAVNLIRDIADQTNLLALNATIEAARAGEHGKGFAVVASEVKMLANQTAQATEEIARQVGAIQHASDDAVGAIRSVSSTIEEVNQIAAAVAASMEQQNAAVHSISENVASATRSSQNGVDAMKTVEQASQSARSTGMAVQDLAEVLAKEAEQIRQEVSSFLGGVRAA